VNLILLDTTAFVCSMLFLCPKIAKPNNFDVTLCDRRCGKKYGMESVFILSSLSMVSVYYISHVLSYGAT
jgi:hypothetical protein